MPRGKWVLKSLMLDYRNGQCGKIPSYFNSRGKGYQSPIVYLKLSNKARFFFARNYPISTVLNVECFFEVILLIYRFKIVASQIDKTILANGIV